MFQLAYIMAQQKLGRVPDIWLQYPEHFAAVAEDIKQTYGAGIRKSPRVGVHVRRGDYLTDPAFVSLSDTDYYERAFALFPPATEFLVCSDDPDWCIAKWESDPRMFFRKGATDVEDLNALAGCSSLIMANSSFSWWAAYLNPNPDKTIIYPKLWHTDGVSRVGFPKEWQAL